MLIEFAMAGPQVGVARTGPVPEQYVAYVCARERSQNEQNNGRHLQGLLGRLDAQFRTP